MFDLSLKLLLRRLGLLSIVYTLLRVVFYLFNNSTFASAGFAETTLAFLHGLRFDAAAILVVNAPFILLSLAPAGNTLHPRFQVVLKWIFFLTNVPFLALALADVEFFKFIGRRSSTEILGITDDIFAQFGQLVSYYWYLLVGFALLVYLFVRAYPKPEAAAGYSLPKVWLRSLRLLLVAGIVVLGIRGGFQLKPLRPSHAFVLEPAALGHLSLNSPFTFIKGIGKTQLEEKHYFDSDEALRQALNYTPPTQAQEPLNRQNVVIIILESFAAEYVGALNAGQGYTPFLDSLATEGVLFRNAFANGRKSIEALPSVLAGIPALMQEPFITSSYVANQFYGLGTILQEQGYTTAMYHGAANGSMGFNDFARRAGLQHYYGLDEYPTELRKQDFDGQWGIFDEPYLQYVAGRLSDTQKPFLATLFTLSSHQPYTIPEQHKGRFPKGELEIHESVGYADYALRRFFSTASQQPWYSNTLFVITADHTQKSANPAYQNELGHYRVPLLLFHPKQQLQGAQQSQIAQHADIPATVIDFLNIPDARLLPFGQSLLDSTRNGQAVFFNGNAYTLVEQRGVTQLKQNNELVFYTFPDLVPAPAAPQAAQKLKAQVQYFHNGMVNNNLYMVND